MFLYIYIVVQNQMEKVQFVTILVRVYFLILGGINIVIVVSYKWNIYSCKRDIVWDRYMYLK